MMVYLQNWTYVRGGITVKEVFHTKKTIQLSINAMLRALNMQNDE